MARGKGKNWPKLKILAVLKSAHQKFSENALSKLKNSFCEIYYIKQDTLKWSLSKSVGKEFQHCTCSSGQWCASKATF